MTTLTPTRPRPGTAPVVDPLVQARAASNHVSVATTVRQSFTMAYRGLLRIRRTPEQLFDVPLQPIILTLMFTDIFGGAIAGDVQTYLPFFIPGIMVQTVITTSVVTGVQLREDMVKGVFDRLVPRLFDPLGIHDPQWHRCPRGTWDGQQLVPAEWVDGMARSWVRTDGEPPLTHDGLGTWQGPGRCWRWQGRYGQLVVVDPEEGAVVTVTAHEESREERLVALALEALDG